jgi:hypothetical protein
MKSEEGMRLLGIQIVGKKSYGNKTHSSDYFGR